MIVLKIESNGQKTAENGYQYAPFSQKVFSDSKSRSINAAHDEKLSSSGKNLFTMTAFPIFACRLKNSTNKPTSSNKKTDRKPKLFFES